MSIAIKTKNVSLLLSLLILFFIGGGLQLLGVLTPTQSNLIVLTLLSVFILTKRRVLTANVKTDSFKLLFFLGLIFFTALINNSSATSYVVYCYYFLCILIALNSSRIALESLSINKESLFHMAHIFAFMQIAICMLQLIFQNEIVLISKSPLIAEDVVSGSFYLKSDASLAFFFILLSITSFSLNRNFKDSIKTLVFSGGVVYLTGSKISHEVFSIVSISLVLHHFAANAAKLKKINMLFIATFIVLLGVMFFFEQTTVARYHLEEVLHEAYLNINKYESSHRFAPIAEMLYGDLSIFGNGLLTYFNPVNKTWHYYSGHSFIYSMYFDCGLALIIITALFLFMTLARKIKTLFFAIVYFLSILLYSLTNFTPTDIAFLFSLGLFISMHSKLEPKLHLISNEPQPAPSQAGRGSLHGDFSAHRVKQLRVSP